MDLKTYLFKLDLDKRKTFAGKCGTTLGHLQNVAYGYRRPSTDLAVAIERVSDRFVTRRDLFPESYSTKWPELATPAKAAA